jgi:EAL domain-containing protein (putative c-di-GMP-specific phosphodiesterase class I)
VIRTALAQMRVWKQQGLEVQISVNVSCGQLFDEAFVEKLGKNLKEYSDISPAALQLEVLESSMLNDLEEVSGIMQRSRQLGVSFALDDFGPGYSSLAYLKHLPASVLKIDQSFVREMMESSDDLSIISGVIGMAKAFGLQVIAEGVESIEHGNLLLRLGCEQAQGYGIARPMPADEFPSWLQHWKAAPSWAGQKPVETQNLPLLYAEVEHRCWVMELERWLCGESEGTPIMDHHQCKVGLWIDSEAYSRFGLRPKFSQLNHLHRDLHRLGQSAVSMHAKGESEAALMMLPEIKQQRDLLLAELKMLIG